MGGMWGGISFLIKRFFGYRIRWIIKLRIL